MRQIFFIKVPFLFYYSFVMHYRNIRMANTCSTNPKLNFIFVKTFFLFHPTNPVDTHTHDIRTNVTTLF